MKPNLGPPKRSDLTPDDLSAREALGLVGELMYGGGSQSALASRLTQHGDREVSQVVVNHWLSGRNAMKPWALKALEAVCVDAIGGLQARASVLQAVLPEIRRLLSEAEKPPAQDPHDKQEKAS